MKAIDDLSYKHEIQQLQGENLRLRAEIKALRALLVSVKKKVYE